jgi:hypothetical protein
MNILKFIKRRSVRSANIVIKPNQKKSVELDLARKRERSGRRITSLSIQMQKALARQATAEDIGEMRADSTKINSHFHYFKVKCESELRKSIQRR